MDMDIEPENKRNEIKPPPPMTLLEKEIEFEIHCADEKLEPDYGISSHLDVYARAAALVAQKYIEQAYRDGFTSSNDGWNGSMTSITWDKVDNALFEKQVQEWLKENGVI